MKQLADWLWFRFSRPVVDETGLPGAFDFTLQMTADEAMGVDTEIEAIHEQSGLKISSARRESEMLIVDKVSPPSGN